MPAATLAPTTVEVFNYWVTEGGSTGQVVSVGKASLQTIREVLRAEPLLGTGERVPADQLDTSGHYRRTATGWGPAAEAAVADGISPEAPACAG